MAKLIEQARYERRSIDRMGNHFDLNCRLMENPKTGERTEQILQVKHLGKLLTIQETLAIQAISKVIARAYRVGVKRVTLDMVNRYYHKTKNQYDIWAIGVMWQKIIYQQRWPGETHSLYRDLHNWMHDCI